MGDRSHVVQGFSRLLILFFVTLGLVACTSPGFRVYESLDGSLVLQYPREWSIRDEKEYQVRFETPEGFLSVTWGESKIGEDEDTTFRNMAQTMINMVSQTPGQDFLTLLDNGNWESNIHPGYFSEFTVVDARRDWRRLFWLMVWFPSRPGEMCQVSYARQSPGPITQEERETVSKIVSTMRFSK